MMNKKIDVTSTAIEKGVDLIQDTITSLIVPVTKRAETTLKDKWAYKRLKNQLKILEKTKKLCLKYNMDIKNISMKQLCPWIDSSGYEEDEEMQDKWATLLANLLDSSQNIESHVFPVILQEISKDEFIFLENIYLNDVYFKKRWQKELEQFRRDRKEVEEIIRQQIADIMVNIDKNRQNIKLWSELRFKKNKLNEKIDYLDKEEIKILEKIRRPILVDRTKLKKYEIANIIRLGLVSYEYDLDLESTKIAVIKDGEGNFWLSHKDLRNKIRTIREFVFTELGELFFEACTQKQNDTK